MDYSRQFFEQSFTIIEEKIPEVIPFMAAGLVGEGSDCFGFDDEISRDHDYGPGFCIWLSEKKYTQLSEKLTSILKSLSKTFDGLETRTISGRTGIFSIKEFYGKFTGLDSLPSSYDEWISIPEPNLAAAVNGCVFMDNLGEFSAIREKLLLFYPEDIRLQKLTRCCGIAGQIGQYNYARNLDRTEMVSLQVMKGRFFENVAAIVYLNNKKYMPYYKWAYIGLKDLPVLGKEIYIKLELLAGLPDGEQYFCIMSELCSTITEALRCNGLSDCDSSFLIDHLKSLLMKIQDESIRRKGVSLV